MHWHGPDLQITETAYAPDDPLVSDALLITKDFAFNFEEQVDAEQVGLLASMALAVAARR